MKILFVQKMNGISGSELYALQIMPELKRRGYDIEMLIIYPVTGYNNKRFIEYLAEHGIRTHEIYNHGALSPLLFYKINRLLKKGRYDIVQTNLVHADTWLSIVKFLWRRKLKIVSVKHGYHPAYQARHGFDLTYLKRDPYYWIQKFASRQVNFNITISKGLYKVYVEGGIVKRQYIRNIYYGLTLEKPVDQSSAVQVPGGDFLLMTGRLVPFKGHKYLIEAWKKVHAAFPSLKMLLAGDGNIKDQLIQQVNDAGLQDVIIFMGHVPDPHPLMEKCLFTVVSSVWEGFGLILLESWLHKKAIVAFDAPAMNEVITEGKTGLLAKPMDPDDLAEKIIYMVKNHDIAVQMGDNGWQELHTYFTLKRMTDETEEVYKAIYAGEPVPLNEMPR
ncbi:MAG: glycosyltransferase family 4 protein [Chitinophagaceae bacterium]|nr:glycosyltransferase family 4 protein [Chitinophagaceae bacterium]